MPSRFPPDVDEQVKCHLATGQYSSEDDVLRSALRALKRQEEDLVAIREALRDLDAGDRGTPFDEFVDEFRREKGIPADA